MGSRIGLRRPRSRGEQEKKKLSVSMFMASQISPHGIDFGIYAAERQKNVLRRCVVNRNFFSQNQYQHKRNSNLFFREMKTTFHICSRSFFCFFFVPAFCFVFRRWNLNSFVSLLLPHHTRPFENWISKTETKYTTQLTMKPQTVKCA